MQISCEHVWREVSNYLDGEVDAALRAALEEHVRGCTRCAAVLDGTRNVLHLVGDERVLEIPVGFEKRLRQRLDTERPAPRKSYLSWLVLATAAALIVGALALGNNSALREPRPRAQMAHPAAGVPATLVVYVAEDGKTFHIAGCPLLHDKAKVRSMPASEALLKGYAPCIHCMKQYLSAGLRLPAKQEEIADADTPSHQTRRTP